MRRSSLKSRCTDGIIVIPTAKLSLAPSSVNLVMPIARHRPDGMRHDSSTCREYSTPSKTRGYNTGHHCRVTREDVLYRCNSVGASILPTVECTCPPTLSYSTVVLLICTAAASPSTCIATIPRGTFCLVCTVSCEFGARAFARLSKPSSAAKRDTSTLLSTEIVADRTYDLGSFTTMS